MQGTDEEGAPSPLPFHRQVAEERDRRGLTQQDVADAVGMSLRAYGDFENGKTKKLQARNRRALLRYFELPNHTNGSEARDITRSAWPNDIHVFLDMLGAFLATMDEETRLEWMHEETRRIFSGR